MSRRDVYTVDDVGRGRFLCTKYPIHSPGFGETAVYAITPNGGTSLCTCFAGTGETCRHRQMVEVFRAAGRLSTGSIYHYDCSEWLTVREREEVEP